MPTLPIIHGRQQLEGGGFIHESVDLEFSNGERRKFERVSSRGHGAVMIAAMRGFLVIPVLIAQFSCAAALAQVPTNPVQSGDRMQVANCVRQGLAASPACIENRVASLGPAAFRRVISAA